jgi:hypothetical protein
MVKAHKTIRTFLFTIDFLTTALGLVASAAFITMNYVLDKRVMLLTQSVGMLSVGTQFGLQGIYGVTVINFVFIIRNLIVYLRDKRWDDNSSPTMFSSTKRQERIQLGIMFLFIVINVYFAVNPSNWSQMSSYEIAVFAFPLFAAITNVLALAQQQILPLKIWIVASTTCWVAFDILVMSWTNLIGDVFGLAAGTIAIIKLTQLSKKSKNNIT